MQPSAGMLQGDVPTIGVSPVPGQYRASPGGSPDDPQYTQTMAVTGPVSITQVASVGAPIAQPWADIAYPTPSLEFSEGGHDTYSYRVGAPPIPRFLAADKYFTAQIFVNGDAVGEVMQNAHAPAIPTSGVSQSAYRGSY